APGVSMPTASTSRSSWQSRNSTDVTGSMRRPPSTMVNSLARAGRVTHHALRLRLDSSALQNNWRWLQRTAGVPTAGAVKADCYGLGAIEVTRLLAEAGCRDFLVSTWAEAEALGPLPVGVELVVLPGVGPGDLPAAPGGLAPTLST